MQALLTFPSPSPPSTEKETSVHALNHGKSVPSKSNIIFFTIYFRTLSLSFRTLVIVSLKEALEVRTCLCVLFHMWSIR